MRMDREEFRELCSAYVLGAIDGEDCRRFREALQEADAEALAIYAEMRQLATDISLASPAAMPSSAVKEKLFKQISPVRTQDRKAEAPRAKPGLAERLLGWLGGSTGPRLAYGLAAALLALNVWLWAQVQGLDKKLQESRETASALEQKLSGQSHRLTALEDELRRKGELLAILQSPQLELVTMVGQRAQPSAYGKILWDPKEKKAILQLSELPPTPVGKDYQLWVIRDSKPVDAGVFDLKNPDVARNAMFKIDRLAEADRSRIDAFAVTLEPEGGVPQPTGQMYLLGALHPG